ncbi:hypothetical protein D6827_01845, partial [Candidatus Parcubacteria bacterium]
VKNVVDEPPKINEGELIVNDNQDEEVSLDILMGVENINNHTDKEKSGDGLNKNTTDNLSDIGIDQKKKYEENTETSVSDIIKTLSVKQNALITSNQVTSIENTIKDQQATEPKKKKKKRRRRKKKKKNTGDINLTTDQIAISGRKQENIGNYKNVDQENQPETSGTLLPDQRIKFDE